MKKMLILMILFDCAVLALSQQNQEPVYVGTEGPSVSEFAENGTELEEMKYLEPYIQNGKLYFICIALPVNSGNLKPGFEFILSDTHKTKGIYGGSQTNFIPSKSSPYYTKDLWVAGFAETGIITVTDVFLNEQALKKWLVTVKLAE